MSMNRPTNQDDFEPSAGESPDAGWKKIEEWKTGFVDSFIGLGIVSSSRTREVHDAMKDTVTAMKSSKMEPNQYSVEGKFFEELYRQDILTKFQSEECNRGLGDKLVLEENFVIQKKLGEGAMGGVYLALDKGLGALRAIKIPGIVMDELLQERMKREAVVTGYLHEKEESGDHYPTVYYRGNDKNHGLFFVMEYLEGQDFEELVMEKGALDDTSVLRVVYELAKALMVAEQEAVVHRDFKPANFMCVKGKVKIVDLGLCKVGKENKELNERLDQVDAGRDPQDTRAETVTGVVTGTPRYIAPEQIEDSKRAGPPADIYALAASVYFLRTGRGPHHHLTSQTSLLNVHGKKGLPDLPEDASPLLLQVYKKMRAINPKNRARAKGIVELIRQHHPEFDTDALVLRHIGDVQEETRGLLRRRGFLIGGGVTLVVAGLGIGYVMTREEEVKEKSFEELLKDYGPINTPWTDPIDLTDLDTAWPIPTKSEHKVWAAPREVRWTNVGGKFKSVAPVKIIQNKHELVIIATNGGLQYVDLKTGETRDALFELTPQEIAQHGQEAAEQLRKKKIAQLNQDVLRVCSGIEFDVANFKPIPEDSTVGKINKQFVSKGGAKRHIYANAQRSLSQAELEQGYQ